MPYEAGESYRGIWGLYGTYDYFSPQVYRLSTTAISLGTTAQKWLSKRIALQGTVLAGGGYGSAGSIFPDPTNQTDYHYGFTPQQLLSLRLILGTRAMFDLTGRNYYITDFGARRAPGHESIQQGNAGFTLRLFGHQAVSVTYQIANRYADYQAGIPDRHQRIETVFFTYTLLGHPHFRAVEWR